MRLIDADALIEDICESLNQMTNIGISVDGEWLWGKLNDALEHAPTIEERKKGKWIDERDLTCSVCGFECDDPYYLGDANYCPNCGARMER